jgi:hypothetical protein
MKRRLHGELKRASSKPESKIFKDIQQLNKNLEEAKQMIQNTQEQVQSLSVENKLMQDKIISITNQVIETDQFKSKAIEICTDIQQEQQRVLSNLETIQNYFHESKRSLDVAVSKEIEVKIVKDFFPRDDQELTK